jgi:glycosyltransferase involved in cell wall biosynthesis
VFQVRGARWDGVAGRDGRLLRAADRLTARSATDVLAVSRSLADLLIEERIVRRRPVVLGHGGSKGVDTDAFTPDPDRVMDPNAPVLGFAGRLSVDKGIADVVAVADALRGDRPGLRLQIAGAVDPAQPIPADVQRAVEGYEWLGTVARTDMPAILRGWDLLVFPSVREGLPNVVIEAAACGVPTVGWDVTGVRDAVRPGDSGLLVPLGDRRALVDAAALALQPADHARLRAGSLWWVRSTFDSRSLQEAFVAYLDAAGRARGAW